MQHLDEGTIHAWLDGQLPPEEAQQVDAHVAECRQCADAVAEARGLIAASSRILMALDGVPRDVVPASSAPVGGALAPRAAPSDPPAVLPTRRRVRRRWFNNVTLAAAATIVVAVGVTTVMRAGKQRQSSMLPEVASTTRRSGPLADSASAASSSPAAAPLALPNPAPAAESPKSLGAAASSGGQRFAGVAPANEGARDARQSSDRPAPQRKADTGGLTNTVATPAPEVARAKVAQTADLTKDTKAERLSAAPAAPPTSQIRIRGANSLPVDTFTVSVMRGRAASTTQPSTAASVRGRVTDGNATGLAGAMVSVVGTSTAAVTNEAGEYTLGGLTSGPYRILVRHIGYDTASREITVATGQTGTVDVVLRPLPTTLSEVVTTGAAASQRVAPAPRAQQRDRADALEAAPGAPVTAKQSNAIGCYELGITATSASRNGFRQVPRRIALDGEIVPANTDGIWYRARDLARTGTVPNGLWRPTAPDAIEIEWTYGSRTARVRVSGPAGKMMRGTLEEIDRATATGDAGMVVAVRRDCTP
jgi:hypothetical protein